MPISWNVGYIIYVLPALPSSKSFLLSTQSNTASTSCLHKKNIRNECMKIFEGTLITNK